MRGLLNNKKSPSTHRATSFFAALLLAAASRSPQPSFAQSQPPDPEKTTISGTVVNASTHAPVVRALVSTADNRYATLTDGSGHFEFELVKEKTDASSSTGGGLTTLSFSDERELWLTARKPGFLGDGGDRVVAVPGEEVTVPLIPESLIVGRVTLSNADTPSGVTLELLMRQEQEGLPRWVSQSSTQTNSAGEFRFSELLAGSYKLLTHERLDNDPGAIMSGGRLSGFPPVYYAGAPDFAASTTIELSAGQTVQADIALTSQPYYSVRMPVNGDFNGFGLNVQVSLQGHKGPGYSLGYNAGTHRIQGLLPNGNYVVTANAFGEKAASGTANLRVAGGPADGPALTLIPNSGITLDVKEEFTGAATHDSGIQMFVGGMSASRRSFPLRGPRLYLQAILEPADDFVQTGNTGIRPPIGPNDDSMVLENVPPGRYWLRLNSGRGYVASATMGTIDLLREPLVVGTGSTAPVEIILRDDFASLEGVVTGLPAQGARTGRPDSQTVWLYFIPLHDSAGQFQQLNTAPVETFTLPQVVPGSYRVLAFLRPPHNFLYRDPEAMRPYENKGQVIHLTAGQKAALQVQIISGDE